MQYNYNRKTTDKVIHDPQYYRAERHTNQFDSFQTARCMEYSEPKYNGRILFGGRR